MSKPDRIIEFLEHTYGKLPATAADVPAHPCYRGYFDCFNRREYYEAHDVLEHLWLDTSALSADYAFFKGLIQLAGGFVHLRHHHREPAHRVHGRRLRPAAKLFRLAIANLEPAAPRRHDLDVDQTLRLAREYLAALEANGFQKNPWRPARAPVIHLDSRK